MQHRACGRVAGRTELGERRGLCHHLPLPYKSLVATRSDESAELIEPILDQCVGKYRVWMELVPRTNHSDSPIGIGSKGPPFKVASRSQAVDKKIAGPERTQRTNSRWMNSLPSHA